MSVFLHAAPGGAHSICSKHWWQAMAETLRASAPPVSFFSKARQLWSPTGLQGGRDTSTVAPMMPHMCSVGLHISWRSSQQAQQGRPLSTSGTHTGHGQRL